MSNVTEFTTGCEVCTATMTLPIEPGGEHFGAPLSIGYYSGSDEIWIEGDCGRQNIPAACLKDVIRQLRRAALLAAAAIAEEKS